MEMMGTETLTAIPALRLLDIRKRFGSTVAVDGVSINLWPGEVVGLVGPNGCGKTTLARVMAGGLRPDSGSLVLAGTAVSFAHPADAIRRGVTMLAQGFELCPNLSALENIFFGQELVKGPRLLGLLDKTAMKRSGAELLSRVGAAALDLGARVGELSGGQQRAIAVARVLAQRPTVLVLDEPSASLGMAQRSNLSRLIGEAARGGTSVVLITHHLDELACCNRIVVMQKGRLVTAAPATQLTRDELAGFLLG